MSQGSPAPASTAGAQAAALFPRIFDDLQTVETRLRQVIHSRLPVVPEVFLHTVHAGGKRVRPALALLAGRAAGRANEATFDVAVAVELIHLASLIHDDVIDESGRRRARLTANRVWGNKNAILVADYTHAMAYRLLAQRCPIATIERLSATVVRMVEGELSQMYNQGSLEVTEALYLEMIGDKTASLMALSAELGAVVSGAAPEAVACLAEYGLKVGLAFQIVDDLLDLIGDEERLGKPIGNDVRMGRLTLPLIHTLSNGDAAASDELTALLAQEDLSTDDLKAIRGVAERAGGVAYTRERARALAAEARAALQDLPASESREALEALADYVVLRSQ